jgi:ElaB/YqjD/DUF883 family membrane-anchored ribosome-binding protein
MSAANTAKMGDRTLHDDVSQLRDDLSQLRQDVSSLAGELLGVAKESASGAYDTAKKRGMEIADTLEEQVQEHPLATVGIAFGAGLLAGVLLRRR